MYDVERVKIACAPYLFTVSTQEPSDQAVPTRTSPAPERGTNQMPFFGT